MRYYLYISETKVNMLYDQIPDSLLKKLAAEVKIDLKLLSASFTEKSSTKSLVSKVDIVINYLKKNEKIGTVDQPESYFSGCMDLCWGPLFSRVTGAVYFGGATSNTVLGLAGSLQHVIGESSETIIKNPFESKSSLPALIPLIRSEIEAKDGQVVSASQREKEQILGEIAKINASMNGPSQKVEFVAKRLLNSEGPISVNGPFGFVNKKILLGSPIYVALIE